jgi:ABC-2 type transport system ATP-binding protein
LLSEVELVCDRVAVLHRGKLVRLGRTVDLLQSGGQTEIMARGIAANAFAGAVAQDGVVRFTVESSRQRVALEDVWHLGGEILSVNPVRRSLEDIFLEVTANQESKSEGAQ